MKPEETIRLSEFPARFGTHGCGIVVYTGGR